MKNILLLLHDDGGQEARLQAALDVTRATEGHLTCLDIVTVPVLADDSMYGGAMQAVLLADERQREDSNRLRLEPRLAAEQISWDWIDATGSFAPCLARAAGLADLIVLNRNLTDLGDMRSVAAEVAVKSGKPILVVSEDAKGITLGGRALVAWDGSPAAMAALRAAVPLLRLAEAVSLLEVNDGSLEAPVLDAATYLSRHGIHAEIHREYTRQDPAATIILGKIKDERADYVVMGGFGHLRFIEALFGGTTRRMLGSCPVPLFLAH